MKLLTKLRQLPEKKKKIIFWSILIMVAIILFTFYINRMVQTIQRLGKSNLSEELKINELKDNIINLLQNR